MTQPTPPTPEQSLSEAGALSNIQTVRLTLAFGTTTENGVDLHRVSLAQELADALRPKVRGWLASVSVKSPVPYEVGYLPDATEVPYFEAAPNVRASALIAASFPPVNIPHVPNAQFLLKAEFLALIAVANNRRAILVKRITASKVVLKPDRKFLGMFSDDQTLVPVESPIVELDHSYHTLVSSGHAFMASVDESERLFGFEATLAAKVAANIQAIAAVLPVSDEAAFTRVCEGNRLYRKKLQSVAGRGVFSRPIAELRAFVEAEQLNLQFVEVNGTTQLVVHETNEWLRDLLRFLDEDFVTGGITTTKYIANSKRKR